MFARFICSFSSIRILRTRHFLYGNCWQVRMANRLPIVVILGATGCGKTKLSLDLAQKFGGEIISADSMQVYKGMDIITAKATAQERALVPHHLIDILSPTDVFTVVDYRNKAVQIVDSLIEKNKLPIVVGGTNYYIESLLWKILIEDGNGRITPFQPGTSSNNEHTLPSVELHKKLQSLDPAMARRLHPNDKRKILRALEVMHRKGRKMSEILEEQQKSAGGSSSGGGLRYPNAVVLWVQCEQAVLDDRLDKRVDSMIDQGLVEELTQFRNKYIAERIQKNESIDYTIGILQSIGLKEFRDYLILNEEDRKSDAGNKLFTEGVKQMKIVTRRYARRQKKWIEIRFLGRLDREAPPVYGLDATDLEKWDENVTQRAFQILESYISNTPCPHERLPFKKAGSTSNANEFSYKCEVCECICVGKYTWSIHRNSKRHKREVKKKLKAQSKNTE